MEPCLQSSELLQQRIVILIQVIHLSFNRISGRDGSVGGVIGAMAMLRQGLALRREHLR
jgi:hypothetical protein